MAYDVLGDIFFSNREYAKAEALWKKALESDDIQLKVFVYSSMIDLYEKTGKPYAALDMARKRMKLKDEMIQRREKTRIAEMQMKYDNEVVKKQMYRKLTILLSVVIALLAALFIVVIYHRRKVRKFNGIIDMAFERIKKYEEQITILENSGKNVEDNVRRLHDKIDSIYSSISHRLAHGETLSGTDRGGRNYGNMEPRRHQRFHRLLQGTPLRPSDGMGKRIQQPHAGTNGVSHSRFYGHRPRLHTAHIRHRGIIITLYKGSPERKEKQEQITLISPK